MKVLIVDEQRLFGEAMRAVLESEGIAVAGVATTGAQALALASERRPDLVLLDRRLPDMDGVELGRALLEDDPERKLVMVTAAGDADAARAAIDAGFQGYVTKEADFRQLLSSLAAVEGGQVVLTPRLAGAVMGSARVSEGIDLLASSLTAREREILALLVRGASGKEMSKQLKLRPNTVRTHVQNVLTKLQVHSRLEAVSCAIRNGLVTSDGTIASEEFHPLRSASEELHPLRAASGD